MNKGLARLIFLIVFFIPVAWYLILQLFGDNNFSLELQSPLGTCLQTETIKVIHAEDSLSVAETNYFERVSYYTNKRSVTLEEKSREFFQCINQSGMDLVLVSKEGVWGGYELSREGVDQLITELDILLLQDNYGKGTYR